MVVNSDWAQVEVIELENDGSGLAFGIIGGRSTGVVVKTILPGGVADRDGRLQSGDHILRIGDVSMRGLGCEQAAAVLRQCGVRVRLLVARPAESTPDLRSLGASNAPIVPTRVLGDPDELDRHLVESGYAECVAPPPPEPPLVDRYEDRYVYHRGTGGVDLELLPISIVDVVRNPVAVGPAVIPKPVRISPASGPPAAPLLPLDAALRPAPNQNFNQPEVETFSVQLGKDVYGLGITVAGYVCEEEELSGIFVKSISTGSSADLCNKIQINDRIVEVDDKPLLEVSNHQAVEILRCTGAVVKLKLERFLRGPRYERLQLAIKAQGHNKLIDPPSPSVTSLPRCTATMYEESSIIDPEPESRAIPGSPATAYSVSICSGVGVNQSGFLGGMDLEDVEIVIGGREGGGVATLRAIQDKWREILSLQPEGDYKDVDIVVGRMMKEPGGGLGISLEGTVEVQGGREVRPHHYIRSLLQDGPVGRSGALKAGDELLEVNGRRLLGLHHLEVVRALKQLPAEVCLVCARAPARRPLIDTAQHKAAFAARNILGGSLQNLLPPPERMIKAKSESSIASLCSTNATVTPTNIANPSLKSRSRSLEPMSGLAMWSDHPEYIELVKGDRGLGFSILDYQDPVEPRGTVIVVRSVVSGGAAARGGRLRPGDRLLSVNGLELASASLAQAVQALKAAPKGIVRIGVAKPLPSSSLGSGDKCKRNDSLSSQECVNSGASDDHTGFDSYHECLQEYQECLEVVQICLEPEDPSLREDDMSNLEDFSFEEMNNDPAVVNGLKNGKSNHKSSNLTNGDKSRYEIGSKDCAGTEFYNVRDLISDNMKYNGEDIKLSDIRRSDDSLDGNDEDMTITEDDHDHLSKLCSETKHMNNSSKNNTSFSDKSPADIVRRKSLSKDQSRDLSTSDEMVFAVTPTGLERISFDRYWKEGDIEESSKESEKVMNPDSVKSDESWKDCDSRIVTPNEIVLDPNEEVGDKSFRNAYYGNSLLFIDHDMTDGYDTCLEDDSLSIRIEDTIINNNVGVSEIEKSSSVIQKIEDDSNLNINDQSISQTDSKSIEPETILENTKNSSDLDVNFPKLASTIVDNLSENLNSNAVNEIIEIVVEPEKYTSIIEKTDIHIINNNIVIENNKKVNEPKPETNKIEPTIEKVIEKAKVNEPKPKSKVHRIRVVEYYNDQAECLEEYKRQLKLEEEAKAKSKQKEKEKELRIQRSKEFLAGKQQSEESTDQEINFPVVGCHQCFLENYAYEITQAYYAEASKCKFCAVVREMLEPPKRLPDRSRSAPALLDATYKVKPPAGQGTGSNLLEIPGVPKDRRKSAGPLKFFPCRMESSLIPTMTVSRDKYSGSPTVSRGRSKSPASSVDKHWGQSRAVAVTREPNTSLGISIVGGKVDITSSGGSGDTASCDVIISGIFIKNVVPGSPAGLCGQLKTGDRILEVDGVDVRTASHEKAVQIIRAAGNPVNFIVQSLLPWNTDSSDLDSQKMVNSSTDTLSESPPAKMAPSPSKPAPSSSRAGPSPARAGPSSMTSPSPTVMVTPSHSIGAATPAKTSGSSKALPPSPSPSIKKTKAPVPPKNPDVQITAPDSDGIESPDEKPIKTPSKTASTPEPVKSPTPSKTMAPPPPEAAPAPPEKKEKVIYSDDEDSDEDEEEDRRDLEGRTCTEKGVEIDRASAGNVKRTKEEKEADPEEEDSFGYTTNKVKKKYSGLGHAVVCVQLERPRQGGGLGLSLAGHRDRSRMAVFVCGLRPGGAADRAGGVKVGDEILEVNGVVLHGRCHLNASAIIKGLAGPIFKVILLRRSQALEDIAVKPLTHFPVSLEEETDENRYSSYKNVRVVTIKKGSQSLGIMIIEGRHAEVGQGIFISDIQEGSAAEQAGLSIGDMILAVNKDTLLGSNYDTAASMLKKTEGVVVLTVCNPNKKDENAAAGTGPAPTVGPVTPGATRAATPATLKAGIATPGHVSRPNTPAGKMSLASPAKAEPPPDPSTSAIVPGKDNLIDINTESKPLGINVVGGQDTLLTGGMVILEVYPDGKAAKDGRLKPGDQILDCNGVKITPEMKHEKALSIIKQTVPRMRMTILRSDTPAFTEIEVDLVKKPGKGVGLAVMAKKPAPGVYISDLIHGGAAEVDGRLQKGDIVISVCGQNLKESSCEEAAAALKSAQGKVSIKVARHKLVR